jgi:hypothetical protein
MTMEYPLKLVKIQLELNCRKRFKEFSMFKTFTLIRINFRA